MQNDHDVIYARRFLETGEIRCFSCNKLLSNPIDQFGDRDKPFCMHCFLNPVVASPNNARAIKAIEEEIDDLEDRINELENEKFELENQLSSLRCHDGKTREDEIKKFCEWYLSSTGEKFQDYRRLMK